MKMVHVGGVRGWDGPEVTHIIYAQSQCANCFFSSFCISLNNDIIYVVIESEIKAMK